MSADPTPTHYPQCPYCNAEWSGKGYYVCGTFNNSGCHDTFPQSALCKKLAATKRELEEAKANASMWHQRYEVQKQAHEFSELAAKKAEARVTELEKEVAEALELALDQCGAESLSGNIVKEEYWKGELAALRRMKQALGQAMPAKEVV